MRTIFLTLGPVACGKDTFLKERNLTDYTISSDDLRKLVGNKIHYIDDNEQIATAISQNNENDTWKLLYELVEKKMYRGETIFVNATHLFKKAFTKYDKLAIKYRYKIVIIDCVKDLFKSLNNNEERLSNLLFERAKKRDIQFSNDREIVNKFVKRYLNFNQNIKRTLNYDILSINDFDLKYIKTGIEPQNFDVYDRVVIIGDVHGDFTNLKKVFDNHYKGTAYVLVGDYLDRGTKNAEVFNYISNLKGSNIYLLRGNHEKYIENYSIGIEKLSYEFSNFTLPELLEANITEKDMKVFTKRLINSLYFIFNGKSYFVSHAGIEEERFKQFKKYSLEYILANETEFTIGLDTLVDNPYNRDIDNLWNNSTINVHGHRNNFNNEIRTNNCYNLTNDNEFTYIELIKDKDTIEVVEPSRDVKSFVKKLYFDIDVTQRVVEENDDLLPIISHNFTREVFSENRWTPITLDARGLFTRGDEVIGRGFKKFFNINENEKSTLDRLVFPVRIYTKYNGFLVITFYDKDTDTIKISNKSGIENRWNTLKISKEVINDKYIENLNDFYSKVENRDYSVLFEVMAPKSGDTHISYYEDNVVSPLAVIKNEDGSFNELAEKGLGIEPIHIATSISDLQVFLDEYNQKINIEGLVLRDNNDYQLKYKASYYNIGKTLRGCLIRKRFSNNKFMSEKENELAKTIYDYLVENNVKKFDPKVYLEAYEKCTRTKE